MQAIIMLSPQRYGVHDLNLESAETDPIHAYTARVPVTTTRCTPSPRIFRFRR